MRKRIFSRLMAMFMAVALLSTSALAYVAIDQDYINGLNQNVQKDENDNQFVSVPQGDDGDNEYKLVEDVKTDYTLKFSGDREVTLDLNGHTIDHQKKAGSVISVGVGTTLTIDDTSGLKDENGYDKGTITGGTGDRVSDITYGGGVCLDIYDMFEDPNRACVILKGGTIKDNTATIGGGIGSCVGGQVTMTGGAILNNVAEDGGAIGVRNSGASVAMTGGTIANNTAQNRGGGIWVTEGSNWTNLLVDGGKIINNSARSGALYGAYSGHVYVKSGIVSGNKGGTVVVSCGGRYTIESAEPAPTVCENGDEYAQHHAVPMPAVAPTCTTTGLTEGSHCEGCGEVYISQEIVPAKGHTPGAPVEENRVEAQPGMSGSYELATYCTECGEEISRTTATIPALPMPVDFGDGFPGGAGADTTIDDEATPLAGIVTEAQLLDALYTHEGSPEAEIVEKYASHEYAPAISWALANGIGVDDEDFDPDEVVTVALLREVLVNFVEYKGVEFTVTVDGADDELVMDLSERLNAFFAELEK